MAEKESHFVVATLWEFIEPLDRGERYEDPLDEALAAVSLGETCGGGSQLSDECGIEFVDIEIQLEDLERGLPLVKAVLEQQGAPKGSLLRYSENGDERRMEFGVTECLAIFFDGVGLPAEVYESSDINVLADQVMEILEAKSLGEIRGSWVGPTETAVFIYGTDAERLYDELRPILEAFPLCQQSRVVLRHGKAELNPRTIRIPLHS